MMTLLSKDLDPNGVDPETGMTAIHAAAAAGNIEACTTLIKYKVCIIIVHISSGKLFFSLCILS